MAEKAMNELLKKYLGISAPRIVIGILMLLFGIIIWIWPSLVAILIAIYLIINGVLVLVDEVMRGKALKSK
ncbi:MAG: DUF3096 domain-containing protein [Thaumarchaeota archaeon]|jgi:uncharacterized membrane protein HdeD (DUF308 family)|nr:DUF3096 domain-containing protein [Nitrososphaerota archaeon]